MLNKIIPNSKAVLDEWPETVTEAVAIQLQLRSRVVPIAPEGFVARTAAGIDIAYTEESNQVVGAAVVVDIATMTVVDQSIAVGTSTFPYIPGLLAFRELPVLLEALTNLTTRPDVVACDGNGLAHPRQFGLACHLGITIGIPTFGVAKTPAINYERPEQQRGSTTSLIMDGDVVGRALRTRATAKPVFVSVGHHIDLDSACRLTLQLAPRYRLPETTRLADHRARATLRDIITG